MNIRYREESREVFYSAGTESTVDHFDIAQLKKIANKNTRQRVRLCAHATTSDLLHEMVIVHNFGEYVRPHKHINKSESLHIIEGLVDLIMFTDDGSISQCLRLGEYASARPFYFRMAAPIFHMLIIRSETLVFHETTNGPFDRSQTLFAPWSPREVDKIQVECFIAEVEQKIKLI
jgi:cupin fold WbuC family metalloprotein